MSDDTSPRLFWSKRGEVACQTHAPTTNDPRWAKDGWTAIAHAAHVQVGYQCQHCNGGPIKHASRASEV